MKKDFSSNRGGGGARNLKIGEEIRHALAQIFMHGESHNHVLDNASITVSEVRLSPDLKNANAYVMPLGGKNKELVMATLVENSAQLRALVASKVELRYVPKIWYKIDTSYEEAHKVNELLNKPEVRRDISHEDE